MDLRTGKGYCCIACVRREQIAADNHKCSSNDANVPFTQQLQPCQPSMWDSHDDKAYSLKHARCVPAKTGKARPADRCLEQALGTLAELTLC
jgi:hypothetical protein